MEINLSKLFSNLAKPFIWLFKLLQGIYWKIRDFLEGGRRSRLTQYSVGSRRPASRTRRKVKVRSRLSSTQKRLKRVQLIRLAAIGFFAAVLVGVVGFFGLFAYYSQDMPEPGQIVRREGFSSKIYDRNGKLLYDLFDEERRMPVDLENMPDYLRQATIAIEDKEFYEHSGFDFLTIVRIPYNIVFRRRLVGGSTLTQQLVKNVLLTNARTISRKFKELVLAIQIERTFTKDEILEMYLNEAPYGGTAWGVGAAAELYFAKDVSELNLVESAFLAGLPQRPSVYSPYSGKTDQDNVPLWQVRTKGVLRRMREDNYITQETYEQALTDLENLEFERGALSIKAPHFVMYVKEILTEKFGEALVEKGGLKITTTLDLELQERAQEIVADEVSQIEDYNISNGASLVMDPRTGEVIAMVGSRDYFGQDNGGQFNVVTDGLRQPGSSIKPVTYLALQRLYRSPWVRVLRAIRVNEDAVQAAGKNVLRFRLEAFVLGSVIMGVGGALYAHFTTFISPSAFDPMFGTFLVWVMLIAGGSGNNKGALLGAVIIWGVWSGTEIFTSRLPELWVTRASAIRIFLVGALLECILIFRPQGLLPEKPPRTPGA